MFVVLIILVVQLFVGGVQTSKNEHGSASQWFLIETKDAQNSRGFGVLQHESKKYDNGAIKVGKTNEGNKNQNQSDLDDHPIQINNVAPGGKIDQSCSSSEDCFKDCKLCDGLDVLFGHRYVWKCDCVNGTCHRFLFENKHMNDLSAPPKKPWKNKCVKEGKCIIVEDYWYDCDGKCITVETPCNQKCDLYDSFCKKDGRCVITTASDRKTYVLKSCDGECMDLSEKCNGKCESYQCEMTNGTCLKANGLSGRKWKDCKGKCIKSSLKCDGTCEWNQCEKVDGTCTYTVSEDSKHINFGICYGKCLELLTWNSTESCNGYCEWLEKHDSILENEKCFYEEEKIRVYY